MLEVRVFGARLAPGSAGRESFRRGRSGAVATLVGAVLLAGCQVQRTLVPESTRQLRVVGTRRVVERPAVSAVAWAPDGRRLAYSTGTSLWVTDLNGTDRSIATVGMLRSISWSRPLDLLAIIDAGVVWTMRPDGTERRRLNLPGVAVDVAWAPGSDRLAVVIVYTADRDPRFELWLTGRDGGFKRSVVRAPKGLAIRDLHWFPDSLYLFYGLSAQSNQIITEAWRVRVAYPDLQRIIIATPARFLRLAPSGQLIALLSGPDVGERRGQILVSRLDGSGRVTLAQGGKRYDGLAWSPQGDKLSFVELRTDTEADSWMADRDGSGRVQLFSFGTEISESTSVLSLLWSPYGRNVAIGTNTGSLAGPIWVISLARR